MEQKNNATISNNIAQRKISACAGLYQAVLAISWLDMKNYLDGILP